MAHELANGRNPDASDGAAFHRENRNGLERRRQPDQSHPERRRLQVDPIDGDRRTKLAVVSPNILPAPRNADGSLNFSPGAVGRNTFRSDGIANLDLASTVG